MENKTFLVPNINCGHCTHTVEMELGDINGVQTVKADMDSGQVTVQWGDLDSGQVTVQWGDPATWEQIKATLVDINYPPAG